MQFSEQKLPPLREDLELIPGEINDQGEQTFIVRDIRANRYVRLGADAFKILAFWEPGLSVEEFMDLLHRDGLLISPEEFQACVVKLSQAQLIEMPPEEITKKVIAKEGDKKKHLFDKFIHNYLFFKIPIVYPDKFINRTINYSGPFFSKEFIFLTAGIFLISLFFVIPQIDRLRTAISVTGNFEMALKFAVSLVIGKSFHELAHAFAAARKGCHIGSLGIGFIVGAPVFYADVTDTWRLKDKNDRILVASAGVIAELVVAVYATVIWLMNINPFVNDVALYLALATWVSTILFNANPLMRFDGYYLLSDFLNIKNLQQKGFASVGQKFREIVFGFPKSDKPIDQKILLYGIGAVIYRFVIISGIALVLYHFAFRLLGIFLFLVEIWIFLFKPFFGQLRIVLKSREFIRKGRVEAGFIGLLFAIAFILIFPFDFSVSAAAIGTRDQVVGLFEKYDAETLEALPQKPVIVQEKDRILNADSQFLQLDLSAAQAEYLMLKTRYERIMTAPQEREFLTSLAADVARAKEKSKHLSEQKNEISLVAPITGYFLPRNEYSPSQIIPAKTQIGTLIGGSNKVIAYLAEKDFYRIKKGMSASFYSGFDLTVYTGRVVDIEKSAIEKIRYPQLSSVYSGPIKSHGTVQSGLYSEEALYRVIIQIDKGTPFLSLLTGHAVIDVKRTNLAMSFLSMLGRLLRREAHLD